MGDLIQVQGKSSKSVEKPTLKQILRADKDVRDFYQLIAKFELRTKALELLEHRINRQKFH